MRLGIFGGSFDPVHYGHLLLAEWGREQARLDVVWLVPASQAPHKDAGARATAQQRLEMLQLAVADNPHLQVADWEIARGGVSYTYETLEMLRNAHPADELFLLMGADSLRDLPTWREPERICKQATPLVARRFGEAELDFSGLNGVATDETIAAAEQLQLSMPVIDLSSTEIRRRVAAGQSLRYQTPPAVIDYISRHSLYGHK